MKANPRYPHFNSVLQEAGADWLVPWEGDCWRYQDIDFPSAKQILSGEGAFRNGGRLNGIGAFRVVYGSAAEKTALDESAARARRYGLTVRKPRILVCIEMKIQKVLDLRHEPLLQALGLTLAELGAEDWETLQSNGTESMGQSLGRAAFDAGVEAILIPSFASAGEMNVAWFPANRARGSVVRIVEGEKLPSGRGEKKRK
jgi:RES domain-containing protein